MSLACFIPIMFIKKHKFFFLNTRNESEIRNHVLFRGTTNNNSNT